jgi:prepilin signal peptidase PulO-like enzyme (type II secretory pathway)
MLMAIFILIVLGLALGSFVNALVWRVHAQAKEQGKKKPSVKELKDLSIISGRSRCVHCKHQLEVADLIPIFSWLSTAGKCRYCKQPISRQYPVVELATAVLFVISWLAWPKLIAGGEYVVFGLWLIILTGLIALVVYDFHWKLLPNRIMKPLAVLAGLFAVLNIMAAYSPLMAFVNTLLAVLVGGGIFYAIFQVSDGKWIGGGDVKLGALLGLLVGTPAKAFLLLFLASILGTLVSLPLLASKRLKRHSTIPFGPFLIVAGVIVLLIGHTVLLWYQQVFFPYNL